MPPPDVSTTYGPGGVTTTTQPGPVGALPGGLDDLMAQVIRKRLMMARGGQVARPAMGAGPQQPIYEAPAVQGRDSGYDLQDENFKRAQQRDALLQMQARQNPAPMRMVTGAGIIPGYTMDTNAMNAYQRQAYLPTHSGFVPPGAAGGDDGREFADFQRSSGADPRGVRGEVGGAAPGTRGGAVVPRGTAPMLTPGNAATPARKRSLAELSRQAQTNAQYGR